MSADRCPTCDRPLASAAALAEWNRGGIYCETIEARDGVCLSPRSDYCNERAIDWRARAIAAESRIASVADELADDLATAQAEIEHAAAKPRRWRKVGPHEYTLRMGPVRIEVSRWHSAVTSRTDGADEWGWATLIGSTRFLRGHHVDKGAPLAQCKADAIAAVERWRDGIR